MLVRDDYSVDVPVNLKHPRGLILGALVEYCERHNAAYKETIDAYTFSTPAAEEIHDKAMAGYLIELDCEYSDARQEMYARVLIRGSRIGKIKWLDVTTSDLADVVRLIHARVMAEKLKGYF